MLSGHRPPLIQVLRLIVVFSIARQFPNRDSSQFAGRLNPPPPPFHDMNFTSTFVATATNQSFPTGVVTTLLIVMSRHRRCCAGALI